jgi:hypothetical protein
MTERVEKKDFKQRKLCRLSKVRAFVKVCDNPGMTSSTFSQPKKLPKKHVSFARKMTYA